MFQRIKPTPIQFDPHNEKHLYFIHQLADLYKEVIDYPSIKTIDSDDFTNIDVKLSDEYQDMNTVKLIYIIH